jgi:phage head maturation protease
MTTEPITRGVTRAVRRSVEIDGVTRQLFVASTGVVDRCDDIVDQDSWMLDNYRANPVVLVDHEYEAECVVGTGAVNVVAGVGLTMEVVKWSRKQAAQDVMLDVEDGILNAVSVGFSPGRVVMRRDLPDGDPRKSDGYGCVYFDCELLEVSIVAIPANPEALAVRHAARVKMPTAEEIADKVIDLLASDPTRRSLLADVASERGDLTHLFPEAPKAAGIDHLFHS